MYDLAKGNVVVAGDGVVAGVDIDDATDIDNAFVIQFESKEEMVKALKTGAAEFTVFDEPASNRQVPN